MENIFTSKDIEKWLKDNPDFFYGVVNDDIIIISDPQSPAHMWFYNKKNKKTTPVALYVFKEVKAALKELL